MKKILILLLVGVFVLSCFAGCGGEPQAQEDPGQVEEIAWPEKPLTLVICYTAGGSSDTANRTLAKAMSEYLGQDINCINVPGGSGSIAGQQVFNAPSDGYTLFGGVAHSVSGWRVLDYADIGWEDFYGFHAGTAPYVLFVKGDSKYNTADDLFEAIAADPNIKWGNAGLGSINQLTGQMMVDLMGLKAVSVPYDGGRDAAIKVIAGEVEFSWCGVSDIMDLAVSGELKILGVCDSEPLTVPSVKGEYVAESMLVNHPELSELEGLLYWGMQVKRDTPPEIVAKLQDAYAYAVDTEEWKTYCETMYLTPVKLTGQEDDELCARLESIYTWGLYDIGLAAEGVSPADFDIPRPEDFSYPPHDRAANAAPWPEE